MNKENIIIFLQKFYQYIKKGRVESNFIISAGNFIMLIALTLNQKITIWFVGLLSVSMIVIFYVFGKFFMNKTESEYFRLVPYYNDDTKANILMLMAMNQYINGDYDKALFNIKTAIEIKEKWL